MVPMSLGSGPSLQRPIPWASVEIAGVDRDEIAYWQRAVEQAPDAHATVRAHVGLTLSTYWEPDSLRNAGPDGERWRTAADVVGQARATGDPTLVSTALLGRLYGTWGPDSHAIRRGLVAELLDLEASNTDPDVAIRAHEWHVLDAFDHGDADAVRRRIAAYRALTADEPDVLPTWRIGCWEATADILAGRLDSAASRYRTILPAASPSIGSQISFQQLTVGAAIDWYLHSLGTELDEAVRGLISSDPRVEHTWRTGLAFVLAESGRADQAAPHLTDLANGGLAAIPRDLNWLVTLWLLAHVAADVGDTTVMDEAAALLEPFRDLDVTHGAGYASYGPVARALGRLAHARGDLAGAEEYYTQVLETRPPGPWTALAQFGLAQVLSEVHPTRARNHAVEAAASFEVWSMTPWAQQSQAVIRSIDQLLGRPMAVLDGAQWRLSRAGESVVVPDGVGVRHLTTLLARAHVPVGATELDGVDRAIIDPAVADPSIDAAAARDYGRRLDRLRAEPDLDDKQRSEIEFLVRQLAAGRYRPASSAEIERARVRVTRALRRCIDAIGHDAPGLVHHLATSITTGRTCCYAPSDGVSWVVTTERTDNPV